MPTFRSQVGRPHRARRRLLQQNRPMADAEHAAELSVFGAGLPPVPRHCKSARPYAALSGFRPIRGGPNRFAFAVPIWDRQAVLRTPSANVLVPNGTACQPSLVVNGRCRIAGNALLPDPFRECERSFLATGPSILVGILGFPETKLTDFRRVNIRDVDATGSVRNCQL